MIDRTLEAIECLAYIVFYACAAYALVMIWELFV